MVYILLGDGAEELEATAPYDVLKRGGVDVAFAGINGRQVESAHGIKYVTECLAAEIDMDKAEMIVIPGGLGGVECIEKSPAALGKVKEAFQRGIEVAAICAGPRVLAGLGLLTGRRIVCYPGLEPEMTGAVTTQASGTLRDGKLTTSRGPGTAIDFGLSLLETLRGRAAAAQVAGQMHYDWK